jgi:hypothetical protein
MSGNHYQFPGRRKVGREIGQTLFSNCRSEFKSRADTACRIEIRLDFTRVEKELRALEEKINEDTIPDQLELYIILYEGGAEYPAVTRLSCLDQKDRAAERVLRTLSIKGARITRLENLFQSAEK